MFDFARGIFLIMIIMWHSMMYFAEGIEIEQGALSLIFGACVKFFQYSMMPAFFIMSGYGFCKRKNVKCIRQQAEYLLLPYCRILLAVAAGVILRRLLTQQTILDAMGYEVLPYLLGMSPGYVEFCGIHLKTIGPAWFLITLMNAWIILNFIMNAGKETVQTILVITCVIAGCLTAGLTLPYCIPQSLLTVGFLYIGYKIKKEKLLERELKSPVGLCCVLLAGIVLVFGEVSMSQNLWKLGVLDYAAAVILGVLVLKAVLFLPQQKGAIATKIMLIGRYSLWIISIHSFEYVFIPWEKLKNSSADKILLVMGIFISRAAFIFAVCCIKKKRISRRRKNR